MNEQKLVVNFTSKLQAGSNCIFVTYNIRNDVMTRCPFICFFTNSFGSKTFGNTKKEMFHTNLYGNRETKLRFYKNKNTIHVCVGVRYVYIHICICICEYDIEFILDVLYVYLCVYVYIVYLAALSLLCSSGRSGIILQEFEEFNCLAVWLYSCGGICLCDDNSTAVRFFCLGVGYFGKLCDTSW